VCPVFCHVEYTVTVTILNSLVLVLFFVRVHAHRRHLGRWWRGSMASRQGMHVSTTGRTCVLQ
jgi:hypothetical protein